MALKAILGDLEGVPEALHEHYTEKDEKFYLTVEAVDGFSLEQVKGLKSALQSERKIAQDSKKALKAFEGIEDAEAARNAIEKLAEMVNQDPDTKLAELREQLEKAFVSKEKKLTEKVAAEKAALSTEIDGLTGQLSSSLIDSAARSAISKHKGVMELLLPIVKNRTKMVKNNGTLTVEVMDEDGTTLLGEGTAPMSVEGFVTQLRNDERYLRAFEGSSASGSGSLNEGGTGGRPAHIISRTDAKNPALYQAAKAAAIKSGRQLEIR